MKAKQTKMKVKRSLSIVLAVILLINPLGSVGQLFPMMTAEAASYLPMPEAPGYHVLNKITAGSDSQCRLHNMGEKMEKTGATGGAWLSNRYGDIKLDGTTVFGVKSSWSITFEDKRFTGDVPDEVMFRMGGAVSIERGGSVSLGNGTSFGKSCNVDGLTKDYATEWLPYNGMKAVIRGSRRASVTYMWYVVADITSPGEKGWKMEVRTKAGESTPVLWLSCTEALRPANAEITPQLLANLKLELGLVPRKSPGTDPIYVKAEAVEISDDSQGIGFRVRDFDWEKISGKEYQIVSVKDASVGRNYRLVEYSGLNFDKLTVNRPITDIAGNPVQLPGTALNVKAQGLILDVLPPFVEVIKLTGTAVDTSMTTPEEQWPEDIDRSRLFSSAGDEVQLRLQLSEVVVHPAAEQMKNVVLTWNIEQGGRPVTSRLIAIEEGYSNGVNGGMVSTLVFEKIKITKDMAPQGERLHGVSLSGGDLLRDYSKNFMAQSGQILDVSGISPDCSNYLDTTGPTAVIEQAVLTEKKENEAFYMVQLSIRDAGDGVQAAGIAGQTGQISLTSYANAPQMTYEYEISNSTNRPDSWSGKGTIGGEGNEVWSSFHTTGDGAYYLHLKLTDIQGKELDDAKGLTLKLQLTDILSNRAEVSLQLADLELDQVAPRLALTQKNIRVSAGEASGISEEPESGDWAEPGNGNKAGTGSGNEAEPGDGNGTGTGSGDATEPGRSDGTEPGSSDVAGTGSGNGAEPGNGNGAEPGSGNATDKGSGNATEPGSGNVTDNGSGNAAEAGSGNGAEPGDGNGTGTGSGDAAEPGSGNGAEPGNGNGAGTGSDSAAEPGSSNAAQPGSSNETEPDSGSIVELANNADSSISAKAAGNNSAVFEAEAAASDLNGIDRIEYQWTNAGEAAAANGWITVPADSMVSEKQSFEDTVSGQTSISRTLHVRAYDKYGNCTEKTLTMKADLSKAVGQFEIVGDPDTPSADTDILIAKPIATDGASSTDNASTRAMVTMDDKTYVRIFTNAEAKILLDKTAADWYLVTTAADGTYGSVTGAQTPDWSFYGPITITLAHSLRDLTPVAGSAVNDAADITLAEDAPLTILYAPERLDVHNVAFANAEDSAGIQLGRTTASSYTYYKIDRSMTGVRFPFTLKNAKIEEWNQRDVDYGASYAVLVKTDAEGNPLENGEVTERVLLNSGEAQSFSVPSSDKDGNAFASGVYVLKVYVQQKAGGAQTFYSPVPLLLDASGIPSRFGVLSYTGTTRAAYSDNSDNGAGLDQVYQAAEGDVLHTINVGVAKPDELDTGIDSSTGMPLEVPGTPMEIGGHPAYLTAAQNALSGSRFHHSGADFALQLTAKWNEEEKPGEYLGVQLGRVTGIRYWNAASTGNPAELEYKSPEPVDGDPSAAQTTLWADVKWYADNYSGCVVDRETLSGKSISDFSLALGGNTICYQLQMENGLESPVYQFELNLCDQAPTLELDYSFGPSVIRRDKIDVTSTSAATTKYAEYIDVSVKDAFSAYGDLTVYHAHYDGGQWNYDKVEQGDTIRLTRSGNGYAGFLGTRTDGTFRNNHTIREFICVVDAAGNAVSAYPILADAAVEDTEQRENKIYYYGIKSDCAIAPVGDIVPANPEYDPDNKYNEFKIPIIAGDNDSLKRTLDYYTLQIDDREPVRVDTGWDDYGYHFQDISNQAGITETSHDGIRFVLPYDPAAEEGAEVSHTVRITAYGYKETPDSLPSAETKEFIVTGINRKPRVELDTESPDQVWIGSVPIRKTAILQDTSAGIYYWNDTSMVVYGNGTYNLNLTDKYGEEYSQELVVDCLPDDPKIEVSTMEPTVGPVMITATSDKYLLSSSIPAGVGNVQQQPASEGEGTKKLTITVPENCFFSIYWEDSDGADSGSVEIYVNNIDNKAIEPEVQWQYDEYMVEEGNIYRGEVTAILKDKNGKYLTDPMTGSRPSYVFVPGGETEYTFSGYVDEAGKTGPDITAMLPVTLLAPQPQFEDIYAPDLAITGYVIRRGASSEVQAAYTQSHDRPEGSRIGLPDYGDENKYGAENVFADMQDMIDKMSWANSYLLRVEAADESAVRLFVKKDLSGGAPDYETGKSDAIEGVKLTGRTLQIDQNTEFVLYAVDEKGNYSTVPIQVTDIGDLPHPDYTQVLTKAGDEVRVYLLPPQLEGVSNLRITNDDNNDGVLDAKTETDAGSAFYGKSYLAVKENKTIIVYYAYDYYDAVCSGSMKVSVNGIDGEPAAAAKTTWSANYDGAGERYTNQEISVQIQFDKPLGEVILTDASGSELGMQTGTATVAWLENRVTVVYEENTPAYRLKVQALANGRETVVDLPEIKTIDKEPPRVQASIQYADNHRSAVVTIRSNEEVILSRTGFRGTDFRQTVKENGTFTYSVADRAGNQGEASVTVDEMITEELTLILSTDGTDASIIDPETYEAKVGDRLYAKTNRQAELFINGAESGQMNAGTWNPFTLQEDSEGLYPSVRAVDGYGNAALVQMSRIPMRDRTAPVLLLNKKQLSASAEKSDEELKALLLSNAAYSDDTTPQERLTVDIRFDRSSKEDRIPATYTVTDEAGNKAEAVCYLRLYDGSEPQVTVNGNGVEWGETMAVQSGEQLIHILSVGEPYKVYQKAGIKTEAQMKTGSALLSAYTAEKEQELAVEITEPGYYTFCIITQGRRTCRFVLYVEE